MTKQNVQASIHCKQNVVFTQNRPRAGVIKQLINKIETERIYLYIFQVLGMEK